MGKPQPTANNVAERIAQACQGFAFDDLAIGQWGYETTAVERGRGKASFDLDLEVQNGQFRITVEKLG